MTVSPLTRSLGPPRSGGHVPSGPAAVPGPGQRPRLLSATESRVTGLGTVGHRDRDTAGLRCDSDSAMTRRTEPASRRRPAGTDCDPGPGQGPRLAGAPGGLTRSLHCHESPPASVPATVTVINIMMITRLPRLSHSRLLSRCLCVTLLFCCGFRSKEPLNIRVPLASNVHIDMIIMS